MVDGLFLYESSIGTFKYNATDYMVKVLTDII
jgi:hypothetical protein